MDAGSWKLEAGSWKLEAGNWKLETGSWKLETGSWKLEAGNWKLETVQIASRLARIQAERFDRDICVAHVTRYSSTPRGGALRIAVFATHGEEQIERLVRKLADVL